MIARNNVFENWKGRVPKSVMPVEGVGFIVEKAVNGEDLGHS